MVEGVTTWRRAALCLLRTRRRTRNWSGKSLTTHNERRKKMVYRFDHYFITAFYCLLRKKKTKPTALIIGTTKWKYLRSQALVGTYFGWGKRVSRLLSNRSLGSRTSEKFPILLLMPSDWLQFMQISARHRKSSLSFGGSMTSIRGCTMNVLRQSQQLPTLHDFLRRNQSYFAQQISSRVLNFTLSKKQEKKNN